MHVKHSGVYSLKSCSMGKSFSLISHACLGRLGRRQPRQKRRSAAAGLYESCVCDITFQMATWICPRTGPNTTQYSMLYLADEYVAIDQNSNSASRLYSNEVSAEELKLDIIMATLTSNLSNNCTVLVVIYVGISRNSTASAPTLAGTASTTSTATSTGAAFGGSPA